MDETFEEKLYRFIFEGMPFEEAVKFFSEKVTVTAKEFENISYSSKVRAFTISGISSLDVLQGVKDEIQKAIADGTPFGEWKKSVNTFLERKGYEGLTPFRADNIFRTNVQTAYQVGKYEQLTDPDILKARPYWEYSSVKDGRTRAIHKALDGMVFPAEHPFWDTWYPPNGYRCRCTVKSRSERDLKRLGKEVQKEAPPVIPTQDGQLLHVIPEQGFDTNPAKAAWTPDLDKYSPELRASYEKVKKER